MDTVVDLLKAIHLRVVGEEFNDATFETDDVEKLAELRSVESECTNFLTPLDAEEVVVDDVEDSFDINVQHDEVSLYTLEDEMEQADEEEESGDESQEEDEDEQYVDAYVNEVQNDVDVPELTAAYINATLNTYVCCNAKCVEAFDSNFVRRTITAMQKMKQKQRVELLYPIVATSVKLHSDRYDKRRKGNDGGDVPVQSTRNGFEYKMLGKVICGKFLLRLFGLGKWTLNNAQKSVAGGIITAPKDGRGSNRRGTMRGKTIAIIEFLNHYSRLHGYPDPCGRGSKRDKPVIYLNANLKKIDLFSEYYVPVMREHGFTPVRYKHFLGIWKKHVPMIKVRSPKTDICDTCCKYRKEGAHDTMVWHLERATMQRDKFNDSVFLSRENGSNTVVITFDFAERVGLPLFSNTPKCMYYIVGLKVDLFGVADNTKLLQQNYVLPESHWPGDKGIDSVGSMLYHNVTTQHGNKKVLKFMADNCAGQNKNRFMIWFLSYLSIAVKDFEEIHLRFLVAGHTKNFCDACFGLCKRSLKGKNVLSPLDVCKLYKNSGRCNRVQTPKTGVVWYDWKAFLGQFFDKTIPMLSMLHEFKFLRSNPGIVYYKHYANSEHWYELQLFKSGITADNVRIPSGDLCGGWTFERESGSFNKMDKIVKETPVTTRLQYLQSLSEDMLVGDMKVPEEEFFGPGFVNVQEW